MIILILQVTKIKILCRKKLYRWKSLHEIRSIIDSLGIGEDVGKFIVFGRQFNSHLHLMYKNSIDISKVVIFFIYGETVESFLGKVLSLVPGICLRLYMFCHMSRSTIYLVFHNLLIDIQFFSRLHIR